MFLPNPTEPGTPTQDEHFPKENKWKLHANPRSPSVGAQGCHGFSDMNPIMGTQMEKKVEHDGGSVGSL